MADEGDIRRGFSAAGRKIVRIQMAPSRREKFCAISALFLRIVETERGINCVQKTLYQFPRDSLFASFRGDDSHRGIFSRCTLTPMEG